MFLTKDEHACLIAQKFPYFGIVSLRNKCILTCDEQKDGLGGILAFRARRLLIDHTSKIEMSGKGKCKQLKIRCNGHQVRPSASLEVTATGWLRIGIASHLYLVSGKV